MFDAAPCSPTPSAFSAALNVAELYAFAVRKPLDIGLAVSFE